MTGWRCCCRCSRSWARSPCPTTQTSPRRLRRSHTLPNSAYPGSYENDFFGTIETVEQGGGLTIVQGPKRMAFPMRHYTRDTFVYQPVGESAGGPAGVTFMVGSDQKATSVWVENLDMYNQGTFTRVTPAR